MENVFILEHVYEIEQIEEIKFIGVFSTYEKAESVVKELKDLPGFNKFDEKCFQINKCKLDHYEWTSGFISWEEANNS
jgi:hypothetical protein